MQIPQRQRVKLQPPQPTRLIKKEHGPSFSLSQGSMLGSELWLVVLLVLAQVWSISTLSGKAT